MNVEHGAARGSWRRHVGRLCWMLGCITAMLAQPARSAAHDTNSDFQLWHQTYVAMKLPKRVLLDVDLQVRRTDQLLADTAGDSGTNQGPAPNTWLIVRPIVGYQALSWFSVWLGYAFNAVLYNEPSMRSTKNVAEDRIFQQAVVSVSRGAWTFKLRTRLEQRYRSHGPGSPGQSDGETSWAIRFRQQAQATFTLREGKPWLLAAWDEVLVNCNRTNYETEPGFSQNRAFLGIGYTPDETILAELGYLNQYTHSYGGSPNELSHALLTSLQFKFDLADGV
ncbi:MAG: DUF2490 domain-containing protein [Myxococcales bacterium]